MLVDSAIGDWRTQFVEAHDEGFTYLDLLTGVDRRRWDPRTGQPLPTGDGEASWEFIAHVFRPSDASARWIRAVTVQARLDSVVDLYPAAGWHEREVSEMFGIDIVDGTGVQRRPLLLSGLDHVTGPDTYPLRKDTPLPARLEREWPGAGGPDAPRRRARTPGVPAMWQGSVEADREGEPHVRG